MEDFNITSGIITIIVGAVILIGVAPVAGLIEDPSSIVAQSVVQIILGLGLLIVGVKTVDGSFKE